MKQVNVHVDSLKTERVQRKVFLQTGDRSREPFSLQWILDFVKGREEYYTNVDMSLKNIVVDDSQNRECGVYVLFYSDETKDEKLERFEKIISQFREVNNANPSL